MVLWIAEFKFPDMVRIDGVERIFAIEETSNTTRCMLNPAWSLLYKLLCKPL
jgi:hypothetical protein